MRTGRAWIILACTAAAALMLPSTAFADDTQTAAMERLFQFVGKWKVDESYAADADGNRPTGKGDASFRKDLKDTYVIGEYRTKSRDMNSDVEGIVMFSYDAKRKQYRHWWFDNTGNVFDQFSAEYDPGAYELTFTQNTFDDNGKANGKARFKYKFQNNGDILFSMAFGDDEGKLETVMDATFSPKSRREEERPAPTGKPSTKPLGGH